jgi:hypothetical protein
MEFGFWTTYLVLASACLLCFTVYEDDKTAMSIVVRVVNAMALPIFMGLCVNLFDKLVRLLA